MLWSLQIVVYAVLTSLEVYERAISPQSTKRNHIKFSFRMEQQSISVAKAGLVCKLNTRCAILAATNPKGKYDPSRGLDVNVNMASPLLSRFDLVLILMDIQNNDWDEKVSSFILDSLTNTSSSPAEEAKLGQFSMFDLKTMKSFISYCKEFSPIMSEPANEILKRYYTSQRLSDQRNSARTTIRLLESLVRLSQAHARLMCKSVVETCDAIVAIDLIEASMQSTCLTGII